MSLDTLPVELLLNIFMELSHLDLCRIRQTSRYLRSLSYDWPFWVQKTWKDFEFPWNLFVQTKYQDPLDRYLEVFDHYFISHWKPSPVQLARLYRLGDLKNPYRRPSLLPPLRQDLSLTDDPPDEYCLQLRYEIPDLQFHLKEAAKTGNLEILKDLITHGIKISNEAEIAAAVAGQDEVIRYFLTQGSSADTFLSHVAMYGHVKILHELVNHGVKVDTLNDALYAAASFNQLATLQFLISHGANDLPLALIAAAQNQHTDIITFIMSYQGDNSISPSRAQEILEYHG